MIGLLIGTNFLVVEEAAIMASQTEISPVGTDQNLATDGIVVGDMCTVGAMNTVTSEVVDIPSDKYVYLIANSGNERSFVSQIARYSMTLFPDSGSMSSRLSGPHSAGSSSFAHVPESSGHETVRPSWRMDMHSGEKDRPTYQSTLEMEVAEPDLC